MTRGFFVRGGHGPARLLVAVLAAVLLAAGAQAVMVPQEEPELARGADAIVLGTVTSAESRWTADRGLETTAEIALDTTVRGTVPGRSVTVTARGGAVDGVAEVVEDEAVLVPGDRGFYLLERGAAGYRVHGARQGVVPVVDDQVWVADGPGAPRAVPAAAYGRRLAALAEGRDAPLEGAMPVTAGGPVIASVSPSKAPAGTGATITIAGTGFGPETPRESRADVGFIYRCTSGTSCVPIYASGRPSFSSNANDIVSWTDTRIEVRVPTGVTSDGYDGSASSGMVWVVTDAGAASAPVSFSVPFGYGRIRWTRAPTYVVNNNCPGVSDAPAAVARAAGTWNAAVPTSAFRLVNGGTTGSTIIDYDGANRVCWKPSSAFSSPGTLAVTTWWYDTSSYAILECDVQFNTGFAWTTGTASGSDHSVEAIMLHEFGHWLNLRDLYGFYDGRPSDTAKVMFGFNSAGFGNLNLKALSADDVQGIRYIYGGAPVTTPTPTPTPTPKPTTPVPQAPYPAPRVLPAQVEAEHFDAGGEGVAYHDADAGNLGNDGMRPGEGVDIETGGGVTDVCYVRAGEYLKYSVEAGPGGSFELAVRAANPDPTTKRIGVLLDGVPATDVAIAPTGDWTQYGSFVTTLSVPSGSHVVTLRCDGVDRVNLDWLRFAPPTPSPTILPTLTTTPPPPPPLAPIPNGVGPPTDTDGDGLYDDINGNGRLDFADVVLFFNELTWIAANEPVSRFDCTANGRIDFADVVWLFSRL